MLRDHPELEFVCVTSRGYYIYQEPTEAGGRRYWCDDVGGGRVVLDTTLFDPEIFYLALAHELGKTKAEAK